MKKILERSERGAEPEQEKACGLRQALSTYVLAFKS